MNGTVIGAALASIRFGPIVAAATLLATHTAPAQQSSVAAPAWAFSVTLGTYVRGNRAAVASWLRQNGYGATEPQHCGYTALLERTCGQSTAYPKLADVELFGWAIGLRRRISERISVEVIGATEQAGTATGRCDDLAPPREPRCTERFITLPFGGKSVAGLVTLGARGFHVGAGPAMFFANWRMEPGELAGLWVDARYGGQTTPVFVRAQYRYYKSTSLSPDLRFTGFHPSTLFLGAGFSLAVDESSR